jgi:hypothetical protein
MLTASKHLVSGVALTLALTARPAQAQGSVSLTPYAGIYVPTRNSFSSVGNDIKRDNSFVGGARLTLWGKSPLGLEISGGYAPARVEIAGATINATRDSKVAVASLRLMLGVSPAVTGVGFYVGAGPAIIRQGHDVLDPGQSTTDIGGNVGAGLRLPLGGGVGVRFDAEDYLYGGNFDGSKKFQNDLALTAGLSIGF